MLLCWNVCSYDRDRRTVEMDFPAVANCFGSTLLMQFLSHTENAQEHMLEMGMIIVSMNVDWENNQG